MTFTSKTLALPVVLALAALPRIGWYLSHQPDLPPDSYSYLNVAREWRGESAPPGSWDDRAQLPRNNMATRTPGYPLFLELVFAAVGRSPTPDAALSEPRRTLIPGTDVRVHHFEHLQTDENVRAVQAVQHGLAVAATGVAFLTLVSWSGSVMTGLVGSLVSVGWNPVWIVTFEPSVMAEALAGVLLIVLMWLASIRPGSAIREHVAGAVCGLSIIVRPAMVFSVMPTLAYLIWIRRKRRGSSFAVLMAPSLLLALLVVNNGFRYQYWGISSVTGVTLISHAALHPEGLPAPLKRLGERIRGNQFGGQVLLYVLSVEERRPYLEAVNEIDHAAFAYVLDHPRWYFASVTAAMIDFFSPPLRMIGGERNVVRQRFPTLWLTLSGCGVVIALAGFVALFMRVPKVVKLGPVVFLASALGTSLTAHTENRRFAVPVVPLLMMSGVAVLYFGSCRLFGEQIADVDSSPGSASVRTASL